jgi:hypothetical protein
VCFSLTARGKIVDRDAEGTEFGFVRGGISTGGFGFGSIFCATMRYQGRYC